MFRCTAYTTHKIPYPHLSAIEMRCAIRRFGTDGMRCQKVDNDPAGKSLEVFGSAGEKGT